MYLDVSKHNVPFLIGLQSPGAFVGKPGMQGDGHLIGIQGAHAVGSRLLGGM